MIKLLIVENDQSLCYIEKTSLEEIIGGYEVLTAQDGKEGLAMWQQERPDVIVADIDMPVMDGFEMVERIRETDKDTIVIFASALTSPGDVKAGFRLGVNNYVKKPFEPEELDAHIQALIRLRDGGRSQVEKGLRQIGRFTLDADHSTLTDTQTGLTQMLTVREAQILSILADNKNEIVRRDALLRLFWNTNGPDYFASRSLDVFVNKLRKLLAADPALKIKTVRGVGLQLQTELA